MQGWICLHRRLLEWEWYSDINATRLFLHCLLKANHKDKKWQGKVIPRGSFITGRNVLADETGLTVQQIRTALDKLKSTNEITIKSTNKNSLVTVVNYGFYQDKPEETTSESANKPLNGQQSNNHNQQCNNGTKRNIGANAPSIPYEEIKDLYNEYFPMLPSCKTLDEKRKSSIRYIWKQQLPSLEHWQRYFSYVRNNCDWVMQPKPNGKKNNITWFIRETNLTAVRNGEYDSEQ